MFREWQVYPLNEYKKIEYEKEGRNLVMKGTEAHAKESGMTFNEMSGDVTSNTLPAKHWLKLDVFLLQPEKFFDMAPSLLKIQK